MNFAEMIRLREGRKEGGEDLVSMSLSLFCLPQYAGMLGIQMKETENENYYSPSNNKYDQKCEVA